MKKYIFNILGIGISFALLWWIFRDQNLAELWTSFLLAHKGYLILGIILILPSFIVRSYRWQFLFPSTAKPYWRNLFSAMMIGYLANNLLPARAGEFIRAYVLGKKEGISKSLVFATIIVERLTDLLVTLFLLALVVWIFPFPSWLIRGGISVGVIGLIALACLAGLTVFGKKLIEWGKSIFSFFPALIIIRLENIALGFITGVASLRQKNNLFKYIAYTIVIWLIETILIWSVAQSFNLPLQLHGALFVMLVIGIGSIVPSSPGNVGTFEFFAASALTFLNITGVSALGFVIVLHALIFLGALLIGFFCLMESSIEDSSIFQHVDNTDS